MSFVHTHLSPCRAVLPGTHLRGTPCPARSDPCGEPASDTVYAYTSVEPKVVPGVKLCFGLFPTSKTPARRAYRRPSRLGHRKRLFEPPDFMPL